jgi:hypothetical protein
MDYFLIPWIRPIKTIIEGTDPFESVGNKNTTGLSNQIVWGDLLNHGFIGLIYSYWFNPGAKGVSNHGKNEPSVMNPYIRFPCYLTDILQSHRQQENEIFNCNVTLMFTSGPTTI